MARLGEIGVAAELLARACAGEDAAQSAIYAAVAAGTFGLIRRLVGGGAHAEDLFQDTMMTFYERLPTFRAEAPLGAWLRQIALSKCLMYLRSPWHRARLRLERLAPDGVGPAVPENAHAPPSPESMDLERALASLTPTARAVVWLFEVEGYTHHEIGRAFGRSPSFSKSQLARAHRRLRAWFEPSGEARACPSI